MKMFRVSKKIKFKTTAKWIHSENDKYEKIDFNKINESKDVVLDLIKEISKIF